MEELESTIKSIASLCQVQPDEVCGKPWDTETLQALRLKRRGCQDYVERGKISKEITKLTRYALRKYKSQMAQKRLEEFSDIQKLEHIHMYPVKKKKVNTIDPSKCADLLSNVYSTNVAFEYASSTSVPSFSIEEVRHAIRCMKKKKCADKHGIVLEMFLHGGDVVLERLHAYLNDILSTGIIPDRWYETYFTMIHKGGAESDANNWRPIAILSITYKILARMVYHRIRKNLDLYQSDDQYGFRHRRSTNHALMVLECMISKSIEFNVPAWFVSIDLKKAFDKVEHGALFTALRAANIDSEYISLLQLLYKEQHGNVGGNRFRISRGVRQGDVLSALLFNTALESAIREWKTMLTTEGFCLCEGNNAERLTNIRYADDLILFAKSLEEATYMTEVLVIILRRYGLELNTTKTKILTTTEVGDEAVHCITDCGSIEIVSKHGKHKYLGRCFTGDLRTRSKAAIDYRISCAWMKFRQLQHTLLDKFVDIKLRLKLFESVISPTLLYSLDTCPLTVLQNERLDVVQRVMLRRIIGWINYSGMTWEESGSVMERNMQKCLEIFPIPTWSEQLIHRKDKMRNECHELPYWTKVVMMWSPVKCSPYNNCRAYRRRGRPLRRWDD